MLSFQKVTLEDRDYLQNRLLEADCRLLNYSYIVQFLYRDVVNFEYAVWEDFLIIKTCINKKERYLFPLGEGDVGAVLDEMLQYALTRGERIAFFQFCEENAKKLVAWAETKVKDNSFYYKFYESRDEFEYMYLSEHLIQLAGGDMKPKRNQINFFTQHYNWSKEIITPENIDSVIQYSKLWDEHKHITAYSRLNSENVALEEAFTYYFELGLQGILIKVDEEVVSFSIGYPLNEDTFLVLFEKGNRNFKGAYTMVNREFVKTFASGYQYVNRAEDGGVEGLRKAKLSYMPDYIQKVYHLNLYKNRDK